MFCKNLKYYRLIKGLSKKELAQLVNVSPMSITHYENGDRYPDMDIMKKIASSLDVKVSDFLIIRNEDVTFVHNEFRKNSSLSKEKQDLVYESVEEYFNRFMDVIELLGGEVLPSIPKCYSLKNSGDIENDAQALRKVLGFAQDGPIDELVGKLENKGFLILIKDIDDDHFSGINGTVNGRPYIMINGLMSSERQRSTIGHELAHLMFDWSSINLDEKEIERYANAIAGAFLFPKVDIIRELGIHRSAISKDMELVAKEYGISMMLLAKRAEVVKVVSESVAKAFYIYASKNGWRKNEPTRILPEKTSLFEQLVYRAINENEISIQRGAELLRSSSKLVVNNCCFSGER
ncbi:MAG: helix-turn-helix domain-containing protein [Bacilli bacterium]